MNIAVYLRKSRAEETSDTIDETLAKHKAVLLEYAKKNKLKIIKTYEEVVSGESLLARPQMLQMLTDVEEDKYDAVLCMDIDRLGRGGMKDQGIILDTFKYSDTKIITPDKIYNLNDDTDEELTEFKTFMSRRELKIINKRLKRGIEETIKQGGFVGCAPYGYKKTVIDKKPTLEIFEDEAYFVRMIFEMYSQGFGMTLIANRLNDLGAKPVRAEKFGRTSIRHILRNPAFIGQVVWHKTTKYNKGKRGNDKIITVFHDPKDWTIVKGLHEPIISEELYDKCQKILKGNYIPPSNDGTTKSSLAGLVVCEKCGMNMQRMHQNSKVPYLLCNTKACCAGAKFTLVEDSVFSFLVQTLDTLLVEISAKTKADTSQIEKNISDVDKELLKVNQQKNKLHELLELEIYDIDTFKERSAVVIEQINKLEILKASLIKDISKINNHDKEKFVEILKKVIATYYSFDAQGRNQLLKSVIRKIHYTKEKKSKPEDFSIEIELKGF